MEDYNMSRIVNPEDSIGGDSVDTTLLSPHIETTKFNDGLIKAESKGKLANWEGLWKQMNVSIPKKSQKNLRKTLREDYSITWSKEIGELDDDIQADRVSLIRLIEENGKKFGKNFIVSVIAGQSGGYGTTYCIDLAKAHKALEVADGKKPISDKKK
jgi:hypothetical protein